MSKYTQTPNRQPLQLHYFKMKVYDRAKYNIWGLTDNESWYNNFGEPEFRNSEPLPFNKQGEPKAYYYYILKAILDFLSQGA
jgi:Glycosyl hydrolase family 10.